MRARTVRPNIYLPVVRFGVVLADWKYILVVTLIGYLVPFFFRLKIGNVPLWFVTGLGAAAVSYFPSFAIRKLVDGPSGSNTFAESTNRRSIARRTLPQDPGKRIASMAS